MNDRQRLEAIVDVVRSYLPPDGISREEAMSRIIELVDPLPTQPEQDPMFWYRRLRDGMYEGPIHNNSVLGKMLRNEKPNEWKPLYTAPPSKQWVGLTDEERRHFNNRLSGSGVAEDIETKLKEKNR